MVPTEAERQRRSSTRVWHLVVSLIVVVLVAVALAAQRFLGGMAQAQLDFVRYFLPAARAVRSGESPFSVDGYFYTPLVAILLAPIADVPWAQLAWTTAMLVAAAGTVFFAVLACTPGWDWPSRCWILAIALVTLLWSWPATMEFFWGQVNLFVTCAIAVAAYSTVRKRHAVAGVALGVAAAIKTWPILLTLWVVRRGSEGRSRTLLAVVAVGLVVVVLAFATGGPETVIMMVTGPLRGSDQAGVVAYSVWGLGKVLFGGLEGVPPLAKRPELALVVGIALGSLVVVLLVVLLRHPGEPVIALYNTTFVVVLLMPISHQVYLLLPLPALWWWIARWVRHDGRLLSGVTATVTAVWWLVCFRLVYVLVPDPRYTVGAAVAITVSTMAAAAVSILAAAIGERQSSGGGTGLPGIAVRPATRSTSSRRR